MEKNLIHIRRCIGEELERRVYQFICPVCGFEYVHIDGAETINGEDDYKAWEGRGNCHVVNMSCENGHRWTINFGEHKGNISLFVTLRCD